MMWFIPFIAASLSSSNSLDFWHGVRGVEIGKTIGSGSYGDVNEVKIKNKLYAMKSAKVRKSGSHTRTAENEINKLHLLDHENVIKYYAHWIDENGLYKIILEYCDGNIVEYFNTLKKIDKNILGRFKKASLTHFQEEKAAMNNMLQQIMCGLAYIHFKGVFHLDVKPENILFKNQENGEVVFKLADFGLSTDQDITSSAIGTPFYMDKDSINNNDLINRKIKELEELEDDPYPDDIAEIRELRSEIYELQSKSYDSAAKDIYAFGKTMFVIAKALDSRKGIPFYNMVTKRLYSDRYKRICFTEEEQIAPNSNRREATSFKEDSEFQSIIRRMMHCDASKRPRAAELVH